MWHITPMIKSRLNDLLGDIASVIRICALFGEEANKLS